MGKASRRKKHLNIPDDCEIKLEHSLDWSLYDILEIKEDAVFARRKDNGLYTIIMPVASWEIDDILPMLSF
jgi:hypothetical protein